MKHTSGATPWWGRILVAGVALTLAALPLPAQEAGADRGWTVRSTAHVDLWYHGLAVVGLVGDGEFPLYSKAYADGVRAAKQRAGVFPTALDDGAERFRREFRKDDAFQVLHFLPLYFADATEEEMLQALRAVTAETESPADSVAASARRGARIVAAALQKDGHRRLLREYVAALSDEAQRFFTEYWERAIATEATRVAQVARRWNDDLAPSLETFLQGQGTTRGSIFLSPALGTDGRIMPGRGPDGTVIAVRAPLAGDPDASAFAVLRELCFTIVDEAKRTARVEDKRKQEDLSGRAAVRCGDMLLERFAAPEAVRYRATFLEAADAPVTAKFETVYAIPEALVEALQAKIGSSAREGRIARITRNGGWSIRPQPHTDLYYHALAVVAADEGGPLGLYSAEYARRIREIKQELGIYPTLLDSVAPQIREQFARDSVLQTLHFLPLYVPEADTERLIRLLRAAAKRNAGDPAIRGPEMRIGILALRQVAERGGGRRAMELLADAMEREWRVFYRDYWDRYFAEHEQQFVAMQALWDSVLAPPLDRYLQRRRLTSGTVMPSPGLGPEGRIVDLDEAVPDDQVVGVQFPLTGNRPELTVFAFLKELCFLLIDDREIARQVRDRSTLEDVRRRAAVRCGALVLDFYAPTLTSTYRRTFLDAVGAEESATVSAFERVYALRPEIYESVREAIRRR